MSVVIDASIRQLIQVGSRGADVELWQQFLIEQMLLAPGEDDGIFGNLTLLATQAFQKLHGLTVNGVVGPDTWRAAASLAPPPSSSGTGWPPPPSFPALSALQREQLFGKFDYRPIGDGAIEILGTWERDNIVIATVPELAGIPLSWTTDPNRGRAQFHQKAVPQLLALWSAWKSAGLLGRVVSFGGSFNARMQQGATVLSNHAFGLAFDINVKENPLGKTPAARGAPGSVVDLVSLANQNGFFWGGHFQGRPDGMHFELAVLK